MWPTLFSVAVIKHFAKAAWEEKGLCGLHSLGNALQGEIKSESQTATMEKGWHSLAHAQLTFRHSTGLLAWSQSYTQPAGYHSATKTSHGYGCKPIRAEQFSKWGSLRWLTLGCVPTAPKGTQEQGISGRYAMLSRCAVHYRWIKNTVFSFLYTVFSEFVTFHTRNS